MKTIAEWCPHCQREMDLQKIFVPQLCECGETLLPCAQCEQLHTKTGCSECPFEIEDEMYVNHSTMNKICKITGESVNVLDFSKFGIDTKDHDIYMHVIRVDDEVDYKDNIILCIGKKRIKITMDEYLSCVRDV